MINNVEGEVIYKRPFYWTIILWIALKFCELFVLGLFVFSLWFLGFSMEDAYLRNSVTPADISQSFIAGMFFLGIVYYWKNITRRIVFNDSDINNI